MVSLWQNNMRGNRVETPMEGEAGGLNQSHMFPERRLSRQPRLIRLVGGWWSPANSLSTSLHFPALFAHTLLRTKSTWIHLAQLWHHKAQFTFLASTRAPESHCFRETKGTLNRHRKSNTVTSCSGKQHELYWSRIQMTHLNKLKTFSPCSSRHITFVW